MIGPAGPPGDPRATPEAQARVDEAVWGHIRAGRPPDPGIVAELARAERAVLGRRGESELRAGLAASVLGAGALDEVLADPRVTDVAVNGDGSVWVDTGAGMVQVAVDLGGPGARRALAVRLAGLAGRRLDDATAYVDAVLPGGVRMHAVLPPLVPDGPHLTFRVPARHHATLGQLQRWGMFGDAQAALLRRLVHRRRSFVVTGGTGAGKTTLLAALLSGADPRERIVVVEDVRELAVGHPHVVRLEGRPANVEGVGEVSMVALVRQALRMRPDRLVVGEVRGAEVRELLAALNTGHEGGCGTVHANAPGDVVARFEALGALAGLPAAAVHAQLTSAVEIVLHVRRGPGGRRLLDSIGVLVAGERGRPRVLSMPAGALGTGGAATDGWRADARAAGRRGADGPGEDARGVGGWEADARVARRLARLLGDDVVGDAAGAVVDGPPGAGGPR